ncbi:MAG: hypothetical protein ABIH84_01185, partial [bacterium]
WIKEDWEKQFNIGASSSTGTTGSELYQFEREEVAEVKGVYAQIDLLGLVKNPSKTINKFVEKSLASVNPFGGLTDLQGDFWTDLDSARQRTMWARLVDPNSLVGKSTPLGFDAVARGFGPINLKNQGIFGAGRIYSPDAGKALVAENVTDVYQKVGEGVLGFVGGKKSALTRNSSYREFSSAVINAAATELDQKKALFMPIIAADPITRKVLEGKIDGFLAEADLFASVEDLGDKIDFLKKGLAKKGFGKDEIKVKDITGVLQGDSKKGILGLDDILDNVEARMKKVETHLGTFNMLAERDAFMRDTAGLRDFVQDVRGFSASFAGRPDTEVLGRFTEAEGITSQVTQLSSRFSNGRYTGGVQDKFLESIGDRYLSGNDSLLNLHIPDPANPANSILSEGYESLASLHNYHRRIYWQESGRDLADGYSKGKLTTQFLWFGSVGEVSIAGKRIQVGLIKDRIQMFTPGYWTGQVIKRTHSFGLVYDPKVEALHPIFKKNPLIREHTFTESFSVPIKGVATSMSVRVKGSEELGHMYSAWRTAHGAWDPAPGLEPMFIGKIVPGVKGRKVDWITDSAINQQAFLDLFNGAHGNLATAVPGAQHLFGEKAVGFFTNPDPAKLEAMRKELVSMLGLEPDGAGLIKNTPENWAKMDGFFKAIGQRKGNSANLDPFVDKVGILQIYASRLSLLQQKIFTKTGLTKIVDPILHLRTRVAQKAAGFASSVAVKLGLGALTAATGGAAAIIMKVLGRAFQALTAVLLDKSKDLLRAILKGDFSRELNEMMDDALKTTEKALACGCLVPLFLAAIGFFMMANVIVSISPVDRAKQALSAVGDAVFGPAVDPPSGSTPSGKFFEEGCNGTTVCGSFRGGVGCHGTDRYWGNYASACAWNIPTASVYGGLGLRGTNLPRFFCSSPRAYPVITLLNSGPEYGFAADYAPTCGDTTVYAPGFDGITSWKITGSFESGNGTGWGVLLRSNGGPSTYTMLVLHLQRTHWSDPRYNPLDVGESFGVLFPHPNGPHVHIELKKNGAVVEPEFNM